jgi:hypothetical protein
VRSIERLSCAVFVALLAGGVVASCGLGIKGGVSSDGGTTHGETGSEGSAPGSDGGADGQGPVDGGDGGMSPVDAGPCPAGAIFCDDFDDAAATAPMFGWTHLAAMGDGGLTIDDEAAVTPPGSLLTTFAPTTSGYLFLREDFTAPSPPRARLTFDLEVDSVGPNRTYVAYIALIGASAYYYLQVFVQADGVYVSEDLQPTSAAEQGSFANCGPALPPKTWTHFDFSIDVASAAPTESLIIGTAAACSHPLQWSGMRSPSYTPSIMIGMPYVNMQPGTMAVRHDDVAFFLP